MAPRKVQFKDQKRGGKGGKDEFHFSKKQLMNKAMFMNEDELKSLLNKVNKKIDINNQIDGKLQQAFKHIGKKRGHLAIE